MKLCIAEKPSVAKDIAAVIGASSRRDGYWEGNGYRVTWTFGHLCTLKEPADYTEKWKWWDLNSLPMLPSKFGIKLIEDNGVKKQFAVIEKLVGDCSEVINCGDAGQEGELIQRWVLAKAKLNKPLKRLWISSLTEEAIKEGFEKLKAGEKYDNLYAAGAARAIGDWMLGMNATRLFTLKFGDKGQVFSIGRVQTPTLALIVERQDVIDNFVSSTYWELKTKYRDVLFSCTKGKIENIDDGQNWMTQIAEEPFIVDGYSQKEGKELPPRLFDLTSLQVECNRKFGTTAEDTLNTVQKLYEKKVVTYPRVDTTFLSEDIYPKIPGILKKMSDYSELTEPLLKSKIKKSKKVFDDKKVTDHHAIIPTGENTSTISPFERQVYDLIARRFLSVFYPDCKVSNTTVTGNVNEIPFKATGKQILEPGWRAIYVDADELVADSENQVMPIFTEGESGPHVPELQEKQTKPPSYYSEATLLRAMETAGKQVDDDELRDLMKENGIGRPSTRANIIETLFKRGYIIRQKKRIIPTPTGRHLISLISNDLLKSAELTGMWEKKLRDIEKGAYAMDDFKNELFDMVATLVHEVKIQQVVEKPVTCPKCSKGEMISGKTAWGCSDWSKGCSFVLNFEFEGVKLSDREMRNLIQNGTSHFRYPFLIQGVSVKKKIKFNDKLKIEIDTSH